MKSIFSEYFKIIVYTIFGLILVLSSYMIIINIHHYEALSSKITVSELDVDYAKYKKQVNDISEIVKVNSSFSDTLKVLKNGGVFRLMPKTELSYSDLYELNNYFINNIVDDCWVSKLKKINKNTFNEEKMEIIINNAKYLNREFINNGLVLSDNRGEKIIKDDYYMILKNYAVFTDIVINMSKV